jgi:hypothetical protein
MIYAYYFDDKRVARRVGLTMPPFRGKLFNTDRDRARRVMVWYIDMEQTPPTFVQYDPEKMPPLPYYGEWKGMLPLQWIDHEGSLRDWRGELIFRFEGIDTNASS